MSFDYELPQGRIKGKKLKIHVHAEPDRHDPERYSVELYFDHPRRPGEKISVARIDNKSHGVPHLDKLYEKGNPKEKLKDDITVHEAAQKFRITGKNMLEDSSGILSGMIECIFKLHLA